jgi:hypothetical protein
MPRTVYKTADVFGIGRDVPKNYVTRTSVDNVFVDSLTRDKHIVVYGSSKQGKTSLRKYNLRPDDYITVTCSNTATLAQLHSAILKEAGYIIEQSTTRTASGQSKINAKASAGINVGIARIAAGGGAESTTTDETSTIAVALELDPSDVNDIIRALEEINFSKFIVLEDFHYLPTDTQGSFSVALKAGLPPKSWRLLDWSCSMTSARTPVPPEAFESRRSDPGGRFHAASVLLSACAACSTSSAS